MEFEEAIKQCKKFIKAFKTDDTKSVIGFDVQAVEILLKALANKNEIINLMALAILNYDDQLVINKYRDLEDVKNHFQELLEEDK